MQSNIVTVPIKRMEEGMMSSVQDLVAVEDPLEIHVAGRSLAITMRTPGSDRELAAGFLFTEGFVRHLGDIASITENDRGRVNVTLTSHNADLESDARRFYITSSCGVCGKASIDALAAQGSTAPDRSRPQVSAVLLASLPDRLREGQRVFEHTGGLHAAGLFDAEGRLLAIREDVGRHNALDKLIGGELLAGRVPLDDRILVLSGRISFELVQKAVMAGIGFIAAVGAPSSLAIETARRFGMTLAGFVRERHFNVYSGEWRIG